MCTGEGQTRSEGGEKQDVGAGSLEADCSLCEWREPRAREGRAAWEMGRGARATEMFGGYIIPWLWHAWSLALGLALVPEITGPT